MSQNGFSGGFHLGIIRDFPVNKQRNIAFGIGIGLPANSFNQNLKISKFNDEFKFIVSDDTPNNINIMYRMKSVCTIIIYKIKIIIYINHG